MTTTDPTDDLVTTAARQYREKFDWADVKSIELVLRLAATSTSVKGSTQRLFSAHGFERAAGRVGVLRVLYFSPTGRMNQNEISNRMQVTSANISYVLEGLERDGLVLRTPHETDRRVTWVQLTADGLEVFSELAPAITTLLGSLGTGFSDEEKILFSGFLDRLRQNAESTQRYIPPATTTAGRPSSASPS